MPIAEGEIEIPVPWGKISGKTWGDKSCSPVLVLHGIQDNCGSFDRLIPLLPKIFYYVCVDFPGHGLSSHFPPGLPLEFMNYVYSVKLVVDHLKWNKFNMIGHSLGAQVTVFFSSLYPNFVEKAVLIDGLTPIVIDVERTPSHLRKIYNNLQSLEKYMLNKKPPSYTYEEALKRLIGSRKTDITKESAECLIKRALAPSDGGFMFSVDQRLKLFLRPSLTMQQMKNIINCMACKTLMIVAQDTYNLLDEVSEELYHERLKEFFLKNPQLKMYLVEGNHDVHLNYPQRVAPYVVAFLLEPNKSSL
ncbi:serine hydrolase-like protein [Halyomorpha halys]|uniref:serine hydrolase-like protein n=1 Tax=Halyomorpha halys TaxID=286706 RepID=UPI0006D5000A|nr:serine hydrolase-like protein [Halyomorpha halys]